MIVITGATGRTGRVAIRRLRWSQIDLEKRTLVVGHSKWEAGTGRAIPLNLTAWQALLRWAQAAILVPSRSITFSQGVNPNGSIPPAREVEISLALCSKTGWVLLPLPRPTAYVYHQTS